MSPKKIASILALVILLGINLLAAGCGTQSPGIVELNISAASSLKDVLGELAATYQKSNTGIKLVINYGASGALQQQIEQGAPADIFISAAEQQMQALLRNAIVDKNDVQELCANQLVLITPIDSNCGITSLDDLAKAKVKNIAIGETRTVPAGQYAVQALRALKLWEGVRNKIVYAKDARAVLAYVETGNVDAGIVYRTDALSDSKVTIAGVVSASDHARIAYPMAVLAASHQREAAREFMQYLGSAEARAILVKYGFVVK